MKIQKSQQVLRADVDFAGFWKLIFKEKSFSEKYNPLIKISRG